MRPPVLRAAMAVIAFALGGPVASAVASVPRPDHVVVVIMENHAYSQVIGASSAPYINGLAAQGASFTASYAITHPSQPNYLDLFSGSDQGITGDACPSQSFSAPNLGSELIGAGLSFTGFSEGMPSNGFAGCDVLLYARRHNPWVDFSNVPAISNLTFASFPSDYTKLPTVSFVVPNVRNDMHDTDVATGDTWMRSNMDAYVQWAKSHNSLLVLTWDEDNDSGGNNQVATIVVGAGVTPGKYGERIDHYGVLRTIEDMYGLGHAGNSAGATPITDIWSASGSGGTGGGGGGTGSGGTAGGTRSSPVHTPTSSHTSLTGLAARKVRLGFTITAGRNAPTLTALSVVLPKGMSFSTSARNLSKGVRATDSRGRRLKFKVTVRHGVLTITFRAGARSVAIRIVSPAVAATKSLASNVKRHRLRLLDVVVAATDTSRRTTGISLRWLRSQLAH